MEDQVDPEVHKKILATLEKGLADENSLTESDRGFLRARAPYIKQKHQDRLPSVFGHKPEEAKAEDKPRRGRPSKEERNQAKAPEVQVQTPQTPPDPYVNNDEDDGEDEESAGQG